jgi:uncharacterized protein (UPF0276 family)
MSSMMQTTTASKPHAIAGVGLGFRAPLADALFARDASASPAVRWLEVHPENYMRRGGSHRSLLATARARWPIVTHGLSMSLGGVDPLDRAYLERLSGFLGEIGAPWHSDHLCFSSAHGAATHDLLPLPMNHDVVEHLVGRIDAVQRALPVPFAVENVSTYVIPPGTTMDEAAFVDAVVRRSGCLLMLDVNNVYVNAKNHGPRGRAPLDVAKSIIDRMPLDRVVQIHVAGHYWEASDDPLLAPGYVIDTHAEPMVDDVFALLAHTLDATGRVPVLLERDDEFPALEVLLAEVARLDAIWQRAPERGMASGALR